MDSKVLIVAPAEGFIIKGIEAKLKGIGIDSIYSAPVVKELSSKTGDESLIIIYTDDRIDDLADAWVFIKDLCFDDSRQVLVIGAKDEYEELVKYIPGQYILEFFERPLDMSALLVTIETYMVTHLVYTKRKSILIVDDDVSYMSMIQVWLKDEYRVSMANSGMEAIKWLVKNHADLVLLDYEMPVLSGPKVLEMIRSEETSTTTPIMFLTGKGDKESVMNVLALKPDGYILKSVNNAELHHTLAEFFESRQEE